MNIIDSEYILDRLLEGEKVEDIAQEMSNELNKAKEAYAGIQKKREEEKLQEEKKLEEKVAYEAKEEAVERILDALCDYYAVSKNDELLKAIHEFKVDNMIEVLDELGEVCSRLGKLEKLEFKYPWF